MYHKKKVSLIFPAYNEEENIKTAINDFKKLKIIDEIIVVDNNSSDQSSQFAKKAGARVVLEKRQGYGFALRKGMMTAKGDLIVLCEPDGTFMATDLKKLLAKTDKYDLVCGTRTNSKYLTKNANMKSFLRYGNIFIAKIIQILYDTSKISDCGCTFRILNRNVVRDISPRLTVGGSHLLPEIVIFVKYLNYSMIEIPVHYNQRIGKSKITGSFFKALGVGFRMLKIIIGYRLVLSFPNLRS